MYPRDDFEALLAPITVEGEPAAGSEAAQRFRPWLAAHGAPELARWNAAMAGRAVRGGYRNPLFAADVMSCSAAIAQPDDGCRAARIRSLFFGASPILEDAEELWIARWQPAADGTSQVWASHQDERDMWKAADSIADFVVKQYLEDPYFTAEDARRVAWPAAWGERPEITAGKGAIPDVVVGIKALHERTDWIVALWFPEGDWYGLGDGLATAPAYAAFDQEWPGVVRWPHLQAYWLWHHLVFDNRDALTRLLPEVERSYAPCDELARLAEHVLADQPCASPLWDARAILGVRTTALASYPQVFEPAARARLAGNDVAAHAVEDVIAAALAALAEATAMPAWELLGAGAGQLEAYEADGIKSMVKDPDEQLAILLRAKRGDAPLLGLALQALARDVDAAWAPLAEAELARSAAFDEGHARHHPGTLTAFVVAHGDWSAGLARTIDVLGPLADLGRWRRLALAAAAERLWLGGTAAAPSPHADSAPSDPARSAHAFLLDEARRYLAQLSSSATDTAAYALERLLARRDPQAIALVAEAAPTTHASRLLGLIAKLMAEHDAAFAPILVAAVRRGVGRHADGEPVAVAVALGRTDPAAARAVLTERYAEDKALTARAVLAAGHLAAAPQDTATHDAALAVLAQLDAAKEAECGAGIALLRAARELDAPGFDDALAAWKARPVSKHAGAALRRWLAEQ